MTDEQYLYLVLTAVYLTDCVSCVHIRGLVFRACRPGRFRWLRPSSQLGNPNGGWMFRFPLPPLGSFVVCGPWPFSVSPEGILSYIAEAPQADRRADQVVMALAWGDVRTVKCLDKEIHVNGSLFVRAASGLVAGHWVSLLNRLRNEKASNRAAAIQSQLSETFCAPAARDRWNSLVRDASDLRLACNSLFALFFLFAPLAVWRMGWSLWLLIPAGAAVVNVAFIVLDFCRIHRKYYSKENGHRRLHAAVMIANPLAAIRSVDVVSRDILAEFHPLTAANVLCQKDSVTRLARSWLLDARHPMLPVCPTEDRLAREIEEWYRRATIDAAEKFLSEIDLNPAELLHPDPPDGATVRSYCPRCLRQFEHATGNCESCGGISLQTWDQNQNRASIDEKAPIPQYASTGLVAPP